MMFGCFFAGLLWAPAAKIRSYPRLTDASARENTKYAKTAERTKLLLFLSLVSRVPHFPFRSFLVIVTAPTLLIRRKQNRPKMGTARRPRIVQVDREVSAIWLAETSQ